MSEDKERAEIALETLLRLGVLLQDMNLEAADQAIILVLLQSIKNVVLAHTLVNMMEVSADES
jgi:hypothetical protein